MVEQINSALSGLHVLYKQLCPFWAAAFFFLYPVIANGQGIALNDDFESGTLSEIWITVNLPEGAFRFVDAPTRTGNGALEITIHRSDKEAIGRDGQLTERAELREAHGVRLQMGVESFYAFSFFLPSDFPIVDTRLVVAHWKQACRDCTKKRSPMVSLRYNGGKLRVYAQAGRTKKRLFVKKIDLRNQWYDMVFRLLPKPDSDGILQVWMNAEQIVDYSGRLGFKDDKEEVYFKMGLYRDTIPNPMHIILDRFRRGKTFSEVSFNGD